MNSKVFWAVCGYAGKKILTRPIEIKKNGDN